MGFKCGLVGMPNVGKSSLLNAICGEPRAIVSSVRGTTRDTIDTVINRENQSFLDLHFFECIQFAFLNPGNFLCAPFFRELLNHQVFLHV